MYYLAINLYTCKCSFNCQAKGLFIRWFFWSLQIVIFVINVLLHISWLGDPMMLHYIIKNKALKDVRTHCYCASLVRTLYMTWRMPRHVFQVRAPSQNSIKCRAGDLCGILICDYFCWIIGDPHFFFGRSLSFLILSIILKNEKNLGLGSFNYFLYTIQIGSNWYMDTDVRDLEVACF